MNAKNTIAMDAAKPNRRIAVAMYLFVMVAAIAMSLPSISGAFLGGDDIQLVRDHVLVNRPSWSHFVELFDPAANRDLYQPIALISLQANFAFVRALGLDLSGLDGAVWVFHLTNILLHAGCAMLVSALAWRLTGRRRVAWIAGVLFAIHPLNVETVAWINGRMMLLSTLFALAAVLLLEKFRLRGRWWIGIAVVLCVVLCHLSKLRVSLPVLLAIPALLAWQRPPRRWWVVWGIALIVTGALTWVNIGLSESLRAGGEGQLTGSRFARSLMALGWYVQHVFVPIGLSPYHAAQAHVGWSDASVWVLGACAVVAGIVIGVWGRNRRIVWIGALWFLAALAVTLPLFATRNLAFAERYMYLPLVGALWPIATLLDGLSQRIMKPLAVLVGCFLAGGLLVTSWWTGTFYRDDVAFTGRAMQVNADDPRMVVKHAWALYRAGDYANALEMADRVTHPHAFVDAATLSDAWQVIGESQARSGGLEESVAALRRATELDPDRAAAHHRLGRALERLGEDEEAIAAYERAAELAPNYNPALTDLAQAYQKHNRPDDARRVYEQILSNNPYDQFAALAVAESDLAAGNQDAARARLESVLKHEPGAVRVRALLAWACYLSGNMQQAREHVRIIDAAVDYSDGSTDTTPFALVVIVKIGLGLQAGDAQTVVTYAHQLADGRAYANPFLFDAVAVVTQRRAEQVSADPWPYYVLCFACSKTDRMDAARIAAKEFKKRMPDPDWRAKVDALIEVAPPQ